MREKGYCCPDVQGTTNCGTIFVAIVGIFCSSPIQLNASEVAPPVVHHALIEAENWIRALF